MMIARTAKGRVREYRVLRERAMRNARAAADALARAPSVDSENFWRGVRDAYVRLARINSGNLVRQARGLGGRRRAG